MIDTTDTTTSSIFDINDLGEVSVWPNPVNNRLNIGFSVQENMTLKAELFDVMGKSVLDLCEREFKVGDHVWMHDLNSSFGSGIYQLVLTNEKGMKRTFQVVKTE